MLGNVTRFAGDLLKRGGKRIVNNTGPWTKAGIAQQFGPDLFFGAVGGAMTPGDLGDKVIAGTTQAVGGGLGGVGLRGLTGSKSGAGLWMSEIAGGWGGDMVGMQVGDQILRAKGGGTTPWEKLSIEQEEQLRKQIYDQIMREQGLA